MVTGALGKEYSDGEVIIRQGEKGDSIYVIQDGYVQVVKEFKGSNSQLAVLGKGDFFGEMAVFEGKPRTATVRALGSARILTIDKNIFLRRINEDPSYIYRFAQIMSRRIRTLSEEVALSKSPTTIYNSTLKPEPRMTEKLGVHIKKLVSSVLSLVAYRSKSMADYASLSMADQYWRLE
jgi:CRP-like cAMP-binding protein